MQREQVSIPKIILYILFALIFYAVQSSTFGAWSIRGYHLDLLPLFVAGAALLDGPTEGAIMGVVIGLLYDLGLGGLDGLYPIFFMLFGMVAGVMSRLTLSRNYISMLLVSSVEMIMIDLLRYFCYLLPQGASLGLILQQTLGSTLLAGLVCFIVYAPMHKISRKFSSY